jgi:hypothetical protein
MIIKSVKLYAYIAVLLCISLISCSSSAKKERGYWDKETNTFIDNSRNIQWQLSNIDDWRVADEKQLPDNMQFCAAADEFGICVSYIAIPADKGESISSIWDASQDYIDGMTNSFKQQAPIFPGISYGEPMVEKIHFLFKEALRITLLTHISDARLLTTDAVGFAIQIYAFVKDDECIEIAAMMPQAIVDEYGTEEPFGDLFNRFGYINATKEIKSQD